MRDLSRARQATKKDLQGKRQQVLSLMLRLGRIYPGRTTWGPAHMNWLMAQKLEHREQRTALEELLHGVRQENERIERLEQAIREAVPEWSLAEVVTALQAMRGIDLIAAVGVLAEIGEPLALFQSARADGLSGPRAVRGPDRGQCQARQHHQGRKWSGPAHPGRSGLGVPASGTRGPREAGEGSGRTKTSAGDCLEGANAAVRTLPLAAAQRQETDDRRHRHRPRARGLHLGDQSRGHGK